MSLGVRIFLAITATLIGIVMILHGTTADVDKAWFSYAFGVFCILIAAAAFLKGRPARFCGSVVGACVFIIALWYLGYELMTGPIAATAAGGPSVVKAGLFLVVFGIPGLLYAVKARFGYGPTYTQDQTLVRERTFHLTLPGKWVGGYDRTSDTWHYEGSSRNEAVTVGILRRTAGADLVTMNEDFDGYLRLRRQQEQALAGGIVLTEPRTQTVSDALTARYDGIDSSSGRRTHTYVIINSKAAASYYYEAMGMSQAEFDTRAKQVLGHVGLVH